MNIKKTVNGTELVVAPEGYLDAFTAPEMDALLNESLDGMTSLIFDFEHLEYISSAGLRVLLSAYKKMANQGTMKLRHVNDDIMEVFELTGIADSLNFE